MKHFEIDWAELVRRLPAWEALPQPARAAWLAMKTGMGGAQVAQLAPAADELVRAGLVSLSPTGIRAVVAEEWRPFHVALRAMDRHRLWEAPSAAGLVAYLEDVLATQDLQMLLGEQGFGSSAYPLRVALADQVSSEEWPEGLLAAGTPKAVAAWERERSTYRQWGQPSVTGMPAFSDAAVLDAARRLLRELMSETAGVPLRGLPARFPEVEPEVLGAALRGCLRYLLLFASMTDDLVPRVGVWPDIAARVRRAAQGPPAPVEVGESWEAAFGMEDMTTVLAAAAAEPIRLRASDGAVFARTRQALEERLVSMPAWVEEALGLDPETRVEIAAATLAAMGFAEAGGSRAGADLSLAATREGTRWLDLPDRERLAALAAPVRDPAEKVPPTWSAAGAGPGFFPASLGFTPPAGTNLREPATRAFLEMPPGAMLEIGAFLEHQARAQNPLLRLMEGKPGVQRMRWGRPVMRVEWERMWSGVLRALITHRLAPLGGVRLGRTEDGTPAFSLTSAGRYLLGAEERLEYGTGAEAAGVVVKPDFEVVFLGPAPGVEARIARFAERVGKGPGAMFRITRRSVLAAAEAGFTAERVLETLAAASKHDLPANVARQVRDWFSATRRVRLRPAVLVECPDAESAARVLSVGGKAVRAVTDTLLELIDTERAARSALVKKLRESGVFVAE